VVSTAFIHGKRAVLALRDAGNTWRDLTPFLTEAGFPGKAGIAETTVFGLGAKTFIGGLLEGQVTMKGFVDFVGNPDAVIPSTPGIDDVLAGLLGTQPDKGLTVVAQVSTQSNLGQILFLPGGEAVSTTNYGLIADLVITDYSTTAPVNNVVAITSTFNLSGATPAEDLVHNSGFTSTGENPPYGLQIIRAATADIFDADWLAAGSGPTSYAELIGTTV
jgi:hypothetical protein